MDLRIEIKARRDYFLLLAIFLIALALRLTTAKYDLLLGADPWKHYKIAEILLNTKEFPLLYSYTFYPRVSPVGTYPGFYYLPVYVYELLKFTGVSFFKIFQLLPAVFGVASIMPLYLLAKELFNKKIALFSVLLFSISPAAIERSLVGYYRGDVFMLFFMLTAFYFFAMSIKKNHYFSLLTGVSLFLCSLFWDGWPLAFGVLVLAFVSAVLVNYFRSETSIRLAVTYAVSIALGLSLIYLFKQHYYQFTIWHLKRPEIIRVFQVFLLSLPILLLEPLRRIADGKFMKSILLLTIGIAILASAYYLGFLSVIQRLADTLVHWSTGVESVSHFGKNITEMQRVSFRYLLYIYNVIALLAPVGILLILKKRQDLGTAFTLGFFAASALTFIWIVRFTFIAAPAICIVGSITAFHIFKSRRRVLSIALLLLLVGNASAAADFSSSARPFVSSELYEALKWIKANTPEDAVIGTWWHYTGPVNAIADRRVPELTTPTSITVGEATLLCTANEENALKIAKERGVDYLLVDRDMYMLWDVILSYSTDENRDIRTSMLARFYRREELRNFTLEYENEEVRVYRPIYQ